MVRTEPDAQSNNNAIIFSKLINIFQISVLQFFVSSQST